MACICLLQKQYKPLLEDSTRFLVSYLILLSVFPILFWSCVVRADCRFGAVFLCRKLLPKFSAATCWCACFVTGWFLSEVCECYLCVSLNVNPHHLFSCPRLKFSILCSLPTCGSLLPAFHHMDAYFESSHSPIYFLIFD
jgi:hypothetical protein